MATASTSTKKKLDIAVLADHELLICRPGRRFERKPFNYGVNYLDQLHTAAIEHDLGSIWLTPGSRLSANAAHWTREHLPISPGIYNVRVHVEASSNIPDFISIDQLEGSYRERRRIHIGIPEHDSRWCEDGVDGWALADVEDSIALLGGLCYLQEALGGEVLYSPGWTCVNMFKRLIKPEHAIKPTRTGPDQGAVDILWTRPLRSDEAAMKYMHFYDRNSQHVAAASGAECGVGEPEHYEGDALEEIRRGKLPECALWRVNLNPDTIISVLPVPKGEMILTSPELYALSGIGNMDIEFREAWVWPVHRRLFRDWSQWVWQARIALKTGGLDCNLQRYPNALARDVAYKLIKIVVTRGVGWLHLGDKYGDQSKNEWDRSDWKSAIVGLATARMWLKVAEYWNQHDMAPVALYTDCLAYCSNDPNPRTAVPNLMNRETGLGGFKLKATVAITDEVVALFASTKSAAQVMHDIKKFVGVEV